VILDDEIWMKKEIVYRVFPTFTSSSSLHFESSYEFCELLLFFLDLLTCISLNAVVLVPCLLVSTEQ
jgi:hypothetical protein